MRFSLPTLGKITPTMSGHTSKASISALPLPPTNHLLIHNLTPDPHTESPSAFRKVQQESPSLQRRARLLAPPAHFSYVSPCPIAFPYQISPAEGEVVTDKQSFIETWLSEREALTERESTSSNSSHLKIYYPKEGKRDQKLELIGLSETGLRDCLPHLHVGDAFDLLGSPTLTRANEEESAPSVSSEGDQCARRDLVDVLSGHASLLSPEDAATEWAPWSLRYSGHQFGVWAGQLGDGRAISIRCVPFFLTCIDRRY